MREMQRKTERKKRGGVFKCPPTKPTSCIHTHTRTQTPFHCQKYPSATPQIIPIFITTSHCLSKQRTHKMKYIFPDLCGLFGLCFLVRVFSQRKQGTKPEPSHPSHHQYSPFLFLPISTTTTTICLYPIFLYTSSIGSSFSSFPFFPFCPYPFLSFFAGLINIHLFLPLTACLPLFLSISIIPFWGSWLSSKITACCEGGCGFWFVLIWCLRRWKGWLWKCHRGVFMKMPRPG